MKTDKEILQELEQDLTRALSITSDFQVRRATQEAKDKLTAHLNLE